MRTCRVILFTVSFSASGPPILGPKWSAAKRQSNRRRLEEESVETERVGKLLCRFGGRSRRHSRRLEEERVEMEIERVGKLLCREAAGGERNIITAVWR